MKICIDCNIAKSLDCFHSSGKSKKTNKKWYRSRCKICHNKKYQPATGKPNLGRFKPGHFPENPFKKGNKPWNLGVQMPLWLKTILRERQSSKILDGKTRNCLNWKKWHESVLIRDGYKCKECLSNQNLHVHHIKFVRDFPELVLDVDNGIVLCKSCHHRLHGKIKCYLKNKKIFKKGFTPWMQGKKHTEEARKKMSDKAKGRIPWNKGKVLPDDIRKKISDSKKLKNKVKENYGN
jgi:5-methylcytosine-specific restriction endonuclease McrA